MKKYLALDISTSHVGICIADESDKILYFDSIDFTKLGEQTIYEKAVFVRVKMRELVDKYGPFETIYIEKATLMFQEGKSRIQVIVLLQQFSALCQFVLMELGVKVEEIHPATAMKAALGVGRKPAWVTDKKSWTAKKFEERHPEIELKRFSKGVREGEIHSNEYDKIDAWMVLQAHKIKGKK